VTACDTDIYGWPVPYHDVSGMTQPCRCTHCGRVYDLGKVTIVQRYLDCSVWQCPGCKLQVDDRGETGWTTRRDYVRLDGNGREVRQR
jgi:phage FluMu protein Com